MLKHCSSVVSLRHKFVSVVIPNLKAGLVAGAPNNTLQATFDPLPIYSVAKAAIASNAPERGRYEFWACR